MTLQADIGCSMTKLLCFSSSALSDLGVGSAFIVTTKNWDTILIQYLFKPCHVLSFNINNIPTCC